MSDSDFYEQENGCYTPVMFIDGLIGMLDTESYNCISICQNDIEWIEYNGRTIPLAANYFNL